MTPLAITGALPWPWSEPLPWWPGDYADIRERLRRDGRFEIEEVWLPDSDDGWPAFCSRHGTYEFNLDWRQLRDRDSDRIRERDNRRRGMTQRVTDAQETWEAAERRRQQDKQAESDREWREAVAAIAAAKAYWSGINPRYGERSFRTVKITKTGVVDGVKLEGGKTYWLPDSVVQAIKWASR